MKVICIKPTGELVLNRIYTITYECKVGFHLCEIEPPVPFDCFLKWRFRLCEEKGDMFINEFITIDEEEKHVLRRN